MWSVLAQITRNNFFYEKTRTQIWCGLAQITMNRLQLFYRNTNTNLSAQITKNNFFLWKDKDKNMVCADTNHGEHITIFSIERQGQKCGLCWHKSQLTYYNFYL